MSLSISTAAIPKRAFYESHTKLHDTVKGRLSAQSLEQIGNRLCVELNEVITDLPDTCKLQKMMSLMTSTSFGHELTMHIGDRG